MCCALCGRIFSSSRGFFTHQLKHRSQDIKQQAKTDSGQSLMKEKLYECNDCGKMFSSVGQCLNHQRSHKQASKSVFHQLDHLKKKSFPCPTCGRCYSRASALDAHRRCHEIKLVKSRSGETERIPSVEPFPAQTEHTTDSEQIEEPEKKSFECMCGKSFRTLCGLGTHQRFSTTCSDARVKGEAKRSFHCSECGKAFVSSLALACHQHWHKRRVRLLGSGQKFKCKDCGRVFTSLTFYNKHQRLAHSKEMPAKSFFNQVVHLQKKAFECEECGLRFSRASALQSHQLCHTDVFNEIMEKSSNAFPGDQMPVSYLSEQDKTEDFAVGGVVYSHDASQIDVLEKELVCDAPGGAEQEVMENGFEIISVTDTDDSGSDCDLQQGQNPDLELVCESDQEEKEDYSFYMNREAEVIPSEQINPEMNVKIVQIDYDHFKGGLEEMDPSSHQEAAKYDCPDCDRTFIKAVALRCHMLWHKGGLGKKSCSRRNQGSAIRRVKCEICGHESFSKAAHYFHLGKHEDRKPYKSMTYQLENLQKNSFKCETCGKQFSRLSALHSHEQHHETVKKPYACLQCDKSYSNPSGLYSHRRICCGSDGQDRKAEQFNPTKTLLGPKVHHCKKCGKGFWSLGAFIHHKQYQQQCADIGTDSSEVSHQSVSGRGRRKRRGRKRGIVNRKTDAESKEEHKCEVCGKSYRMLGCFLKHQLIHNASNNPPPAKSFDYQVEQLKKNSYSCPDCGKLFSRAMALQFHMKSHGYETSLPAEKLSDSSGAPQCQICLAFFTCESALQIHQQHCVKPKSESEEQLEGTPKCELPELNVAQENATVPKQIIKNEKNIEPENVFQMLPSDLPNKYKDCDRGFSIQRKFPFSCSECGRTFSTNSALGTHRRWHKDKRMARHLSKNSKISMKSKGTGNFLCNLCGKEFFYLCVFRRHQKHHPELRGRPAKPQHENTEVNSASPKSSFLCTYCNDSFSDEALRASHMVCVHSSQSDISEDVKNLELEAPLSAQPIKPMSDFPPPYKIVPAKGDKAKLKYQCTNCHKCFSTVRGVRAHKWQKHRRARGRPPVTTNEVTKPLACSACKKRYSSLGALFNHERSCRAYIEAQTQPVAESSPHCSLEPPAKCLFKCHKCGKAFPSEAQLDAHKEAARTRPHSCALCCRGYWTESQLQQHLAWHDEVRKRLPTELRYRLSASSASGPSDEDLVSLVKLPTSATNPQSHKNHDCHHCGETFLSPLALEKHQALHKNQEPYSCSLCPQTFGEIKDLIDHHQECLRDKELRDSAPLLDDESLTCMECGTSFDQETDLHQHYIEHARGVF